MMINSHDTVYIISTREMTRYDKYYGGAICWRCGMRIHIGEKVYAKRARRTGKKIYHYSCAKKVNVV